MLEILHDKNVSTSFLVFVPVNIVKTFLFKIYQFRLKCMMGNHQDNLSLKINLCEAEKTLEHGAWFDYIFQLQ